MNDEPIHVNMDMTTVWLDRDTHLKVPDAITLHDGRTFATQDLYQACQRITVATSDEDNNEIINEFVALKPLDHEYHNLAKIIQPRSESKLFIRAWRVKRPFRYSIIVKPHDYPDANRRWDLSWIPCEFVAYRYAGCWVLRFLTRADQEWCIDNDKQSMFIAASLPNPYKNPCLNRGMRNNNMPRWAQPD